MPLQRDSLPCLWKKGYLKKCCFKVLKQQKTKGTENVNALHSHSINNNDSNSSGGAGGVDSEASCYDYIFSIEGQRHPPSTRTMLLNGTPIIMEFDSGAARTLISNSTYNLLPDCSKPKLNVSNVILRAFGGNVLKVLGEIRLILNVQRLKVLQKWLLLL